jgi:hypothetical protein
MPCINKKYTLFNRSLVFKEDEIEEDLFTVNA